MAEITFTDDFKIGRFKAHDYFGDGSFYLLDVPGHALGHMCGLVRTTPTTFLLLGADTCHTAGCFRPSEFVPMPESLGPEDGLDGYFSSPCPCSVFTQLHPQAVTEEGQKTTPYFEATDMKGYVKFTVSQEHSQFAAQPEVRKTVTDQHLTAGYSSILLPQTGALPASKSMMLCLMCGCCWHMIRH